MIESCIVALIPITIGLILWSIRFGNRASIVDWLTKSVDDIIELEDELKNKSIRKQTSKIRKQDLLELAYLKNSNHPQWVVRVWHEQGKIDSEGNYKE